MLPDLSALTLGLVPVRYKSKEYIRVNPMSDTTTTLTAPDGVWWRNVAYLKAGVIVLLLAWILYDALSPETLPTLTNSASSRVEHAEWHAYVERVYGESVTDPVDLNTFRWFYNWAPLHLLKRRPLGVNDVALYHWRPNLYYCTGNMVCSYYKQYGYFVAKPSYNYGNVPSGRAEVLHHSCIAEDNSTDVWFYYLPGSGVFLKSTTNVSVAVWSNRGQPDELVWKSVSNHYYDVIEGRRVMNCNAFSSGMTHATECECGRGDPITRCIHPLVPSERRRLLGLETC